MRQTPMMKSTYSGSGAAGGDYVGGLVGAMQSGSFINSSYVSGNVEVNGSGGNDYVGGLAGYQIAGYISNSYAKGDVVVDGGGGVDYIGGLVGHLSSAGYIETSYATVTSRNGVAVGGLVG